jgi:hypothetical protein
MMMSKKKEANAILRKVVIGLISLTVIFIVVMLATFKDADAPARDVDTSHMMQNEP